MVSPSMASLEMALFLLQKYIREKEKFFFKMQEEDLRYSNDYMSFLLEIFFFLDVLSLFPLVNNKTWSFVTAIG